MGITGMRKLERQTPDDLRRDLISAVGRYLAEALEAKGVREEEILEDFDFFRRRQSQIRTMSRAFE
jgi:hypothetical protein